MQPFKVILVKMLKKMLKYNKAFQRRKVKISNRIDMNKVRYVYLNKNKVQQISDMLEKTEISVSSEKRFVHWIDESLIVCNGGTVLGNMPPNYEIVINHSLNEMIELNSGIGTIFK